MLSNSHSRQAWDKTWSLLQSLTVVYCGLLMAELAGVSWPGKAGLLLLGTAAAGEAFYSGPGSQLLVCGAALTGALCSLAIPASILQGEQGASFVRNFPALCYAFMGWLIAGTLLPADALFHSKALLTWWKRQTTTLAFATAAYWLIRSYLLNESVPFLTGIAITAALLGMLKIRFSLSEISIQSINTAILLFLGIAAADVLDSWQHRATFQTSPSPEVLRQYCTYSVACERPADYQQWWSYYVTNHAAMERALKVRTKLPGVSMLLRSNAHATLVQSRISINSLGFRGREIPPVKGSTYRIVALGESTTFGFTLSAQDKPWPELLEDMINRRLHPCRPVEVINAGIPGITLAENNHRLEQQILPLKPDLIISYHGLNGFRMLDARLLPNLGPPPPAFIRRPLHLLAEGEYHFKLLFYRRQFLPKGPSALCPPDRLLQSEYARNYQVLIDCARTNGIQLAIANYSMAINEHSKLEEIDFFRRTFPSAFAVIAANTAHSQLIKQLGKLYPELCIIDTHPDLDGEPDLFLDQVHFLHRGEQQMAQNVFVALKPMLQRALCSPPKLPVATN